MQLAGENIDFLAVRDGWAQGRFRGLLVEPRSAQDQLPAENRDVNVRVALCGLSMVFVFVRMRMMMVMVATVVMSVRPVAVRMPML